MPRLNPATFRSLTMRLLKGTTEQRSLTALRNTVFKGIRQSKKEGDSLTEIPLRYKMSDTVAKRVKTDSQRRNLQRGLVQRISKGQESYESLMRAPNRGPKGPFGARAARKYLKARGKAK